MQRRAVLVLFLATAGAAAATQPVALVTELSGRGTVTPRSAGATLELLQELPPGARVALAANARAVVVHTAAGVVYELNGPGSFAVRDRSIDAADRSARLARRELPPEIRAYRLDPSLAVQASLVMRGGGGVRLDGPDGGVLADHELRYRVQGAIDGGTLEVFDAQGTRVLELADEAGSYDLKGRVAWLPGAQYVVQAGGRLPGGRPARLTSRFRLLDPAVASELARLRPSAAAPSTDWIVYALALESRGADATARPIWQALNAAR
jgi:hypothetical protein